LEIFLVVGFKEVVFDRVLYYYGRPSTGRSGWVVCVVGGIVREAEVTFCGEMRLRDDEDVNFMRKKKHLNFVSVS
jgi:hypothetical protein